ncbi:hypothetical protein PR202_gb06455 [Eleusine coracana subsp. coracana]|uniref:Uncharacterized protein n=1 Tax=Eleusine coracana subsp. coracana TaxID=191504 RepID=A0AAV5E9Y9_ELECO|nr:hypothetical protein PR202_gb06455 [Eleusine coracana subsp. coracana]
MAANLPLYLLLASLLVIPIFLLLTSRRRSAARGTRLPLGPWALPVLGHLHYLAVGNKLPHVAMRDLARRHGPLMLLRFGEVPVVVASSPAAVREVMRAHGGAAFASRPLSPTSRLWFQGAGGVSFTPHGDAWRTLRRVCAQELLSARRVHSFRPVREDELRRLLRSVTTSSASEKVVNLTEEVSRYVADSTVRAIIGSRRLRDRDAYLRMLKGLFGIVPGMSLPDLFPSSRLAMLVSRAPKRILAYRCELRRIMDGILQEHEERRAKAGEGDDEEEDMVDVLLRLQKEMNSEFPLTTDNIKSVMLDIFGAGSETSATALNWAMAELLRNPRAMKKAQDEVRQALAGHATVTEDNLTNLHYLRLIIKETLRLHPPPLLLPRKCETACQVLGFDVPAGTTVLVNAWAIGRDPAHWDAPEEFVPERFESEGSRDFRGMDFEFIPFGAGRRICPGITFGVAHVELALAGLLFHFDWELPGGMAPEELDMTEGAGLATRRRYDLLFVAVPRVPVPTK